MALCFFRVIGVVELGAQRTCLMSSFPPPLKFQTKESLPVPPPPKIQSQWIALSWSNLVLYHWGWEIPIAHKHLWSLHSQHRGGGKTHGVLENDKPSEHGGEEKALFLHPPTVSPLPHGVLRKTWWGNRSLSRDSGVVLSQNIKTQATTKKSHLHYRWMWHA